MSGPPVDSNRGLWLNYTLYHPTTSHNMVIANFSICSIRTPPPPSPLARGPTLVLVGPRAQALEVPRRLPPEGSILVRSTPRAQDGAQLLDPRRGPRGSDGSDRQ